MTFWKWSRTAASNATADSTCPFPEGMAPSAVNDGTRGMMAAAAKYRDDVAGAIVTSGSSSAYAVASFQGFDTVAHLDGQTIAFSPHTTNVDTVTLNVDGLGAKPLRTAPGVELVAGTLIQGTPYIALYNNTDGAFYLRGYVSSPFNVPFLGGIDFWDTIAPNSRFIFPQGQQLSRTVYSAAFARWGTQFGVGDGSTTFNAPDVTGRVRAMIEPSASRLTHLSSGNSTVLGGAGGSDTVTMQRTDMPNVTVGISGNTSSVSLPADVAHAPNNYVATNFTTGGGGTVYYLGGGATPSTGGNTGTGTITSGSTASLNGGVSQTAMNNLPPMITCNYIIRIL